MAQLFKELDISNLILGSPDRYISFEYDNYDLALLYHSYNSRQNNFDAVTLYHHNIAGELVNPVYKPNKQQSYTFKTAIWIPDQDTYLIEVVIQSEGFSHTITTTVNEIRQMIHNAPTNYTMLTAFMNRFKIF